MQMQREKLFFIAILPPHDIMAEVTAFKEDMRQNYNSGKALKVLPHVTLKAPFKLNVEECENVHEWFKRIAVPAKPIIITLNNFGSFSSRDNKVIFVEPVITQPLQALQKSIIECFRSTYPHINMSAHEDSFKPHMTIAYRDLTPENYEKAWAVYKNKQYHAEFTCSSFCLLEHNGQKWQVVQEHLLEL